MRRLSLLYFCFHCALVGAPASADDPPMDDRGRRAVTGAPAAEAIAAGEESDELRALREFEERAFHPPPIEDGPSGPPVGPGVVAPVDVDAARASLFQGVILPDLPIRWDPKVIQYVEWFSRDPRGHAVMSSWLRRSGRFEGIVRRILAEKGLPQDLLYVAMNESGFVPTARSPAGAVGLWQLMPDGGAIYGLRQDHWRDERRDPVRCTVAGATYLADLHERFGDWHLAIAAYNMGYNGLLRAIRKYDTNDYWTLSRLEAGLPWETTTYVPKILAAAIIGKNREHFGFGDVRPEPAWSFETVSVPTSVDLGLVARAAGVSRADVVALNPGLLRGRTPPVAAPYEVRIPASARHTFSAAFQKLASQWRGYQRAEVRFGESIARLAHRYRTTPRALRELNGLDGRALRPGEPLVVPAVTPVPDADPDTPPVVVVPDRTLPEDGRRRLLYEAIGGEALADVARAFGVTTQDLRAWNDVSPAARLQDGQWLQILVAPSFDASSIVAIDATQANLLVAGSEEFFEHHESQRNRRRIRVTVADGETLSHLAERYDLTVGSLCRINGLDPRAPIRAGQEVVVYCPIDRLPRPAEPTPAPEPAPAAETAAPEAEAAAETPGETAAVTPPPTPTDG